MLYDRRGYLKTTGLVAAGLVISSPKVSNASNKHYTGIEKIPGIPAQWIDLAGIDVYEYAHYIQSLKLKNITPRMVLAAHFKSRRGIRNSLPPKELWSSIKPTLNVIDRLADTLGQPIEEIYSAYRTPAYNRVVRGKCRSYHMQNRAIDIGFKNTSSWRVAKAAKHLRDKNREFKGGIGVYSGFIHIDTRGENYNW